MNNKTSNRPVSRTEHGFLVSLLMAAAVTLAGCAVPPGKLRLVSKANMVFEDSGAFAYRGKLAGHSEPGFVDAGGAQAAGCTSCR